MVIYVDYKINQKEKINYKANKKHAKIFFNPIW